MTTLNAKVILNVKTAAEWANSTEVLLEGELGIESDTRLIKIGNGTDTYPNLPYTAVSDINDIEGVTVTNPTDGNVLTYSNGEWVNITPSSLPADTDLSHYDNSTSGFITANDIPSLPADTDLSHYDNSTSDFATVSQIPTDVSQLNNDIGYITSADLPTVGDGTITIQANSINVDSFTTNQSGNKTINLTVPTKTSELTNDSGFITSSSQPTVNDATLTIQRNGIAVGTFTANAATNATINISVPTSVSDLTFSGDVLPTIDSAYSIGSASYKWDTVYSNSINTDSITLNGTTYNSLLGDPPFAYTPEAVVSVDGTKLKDTSIGSALVYPQIKQHNGYIYLLGANNSTISKYDATTLTQEWSVSTGGTGASFDVDASGVWLACKISGNLVKKQLSLSDGSTLWSESTTLNLYYPQQVVCHDGKTFFFWYYLYGSQVHLCGISIDESTHTQVDTLPDIDTGTQSVEIVPRPQVKFDSAGNLYVYLVEADHSSLSTSIYKCAASDYSTRVWTVSIGDIAGISSYYQTAISLAVDDNNVYVGCTPNGSTESVIKILDPFTGSLVSTKDLSTDNGSRLQSLEADNNGHLYTLAAVPGTGSYVLGSTYYITKRLVSDWSNVWEKSVSRYNANYGVTASFSNIEDNAIWEVDFTGSTQISGFRTATITLSAQVETAANLMPSTNYGFDLGSSTKRWNTAYIKELNTTTITLGGVSYNSIPTDTNDLTNGAGYITSSSLSSYLPLSGGEMAGSIRVSGSGFTLGNSTQGWSTVYTGNITANSNTMFVGGNSSSVFYFAPSSTASSKYLGGASNYWSAGYIEQLNLSSNCNIITQVSGQALQLSWYDNTDSAAAYIQLIDDCIRGFRAGGGKVSCGSSATPWSAVYASNGTIQPSDIRLKENIEPLEDALKKINALKVYGYTWKETAESITYGVVAQEAIETVPEAVKVSANKEGDVDLGVYTSNMLYLSIKAIQELSSKVDELNAKIKVLEGRV